MSDTVKAIILPDDWDEYDTQQVYDWFAEVATGAKVIELTQEIYTGINKAQNNPVYRRWVSEWEGDPE